MEIDLCLVFEETDKEHIYLSPGKEKENGEERGGDRKQLLGFGFIILFVYVDVCVCGGGIFLVL